MNNNSKKTLADKLTAEMNEEKGGGGKWPASFDYKIEILFKGTNLLTILSGTVSERHDTRFLDYMH